MFVNIDGTAVAIGVVLVFAALVILFPSRAAEGAESVRLTFATFLRSIVELVEVST